ncbi:TPA: 2-oxoacid ferredoxin oxidoreductase, partial [Methanosarcinaceae archaeon]|nr:2-oxoacid ferredoxin oxidoreductase [Methanosarcinaceae archaeon]
MPTFEDFEGQVPAWCPGCGNFQILSSLKQALVELDIEPWEVLIVSGIGQSGKLPHYMKCHTFNGLHGRTLPVATAAKLANDALHVIAVAGDGDCYGEGGNHFIHAIRRNPNVTLLVHDNQIYGLTKGQASPTSDQGTRSKVQPFGSLSEPMNPLALAISLDCSFVARGFAG